MKSHFFLLISFFLLHTNAWSQRNFGLYTGFNYLPQSSLYNPSWTSDNKVYFSIGTGLQSVGFFNTGFKGKQVDISRTQNDSLVIDLEGAIGNMANLNYFGGTAQNEIFALGIKNKKNYFSLGVVNRLDFHIDYPKDFVQMIFEGGGNTFLGQRVSMKGLGVQLKSYLEYSIGASREVNSELKVGARFKMLSGIANIVTRKSELGLSTDASTYDLTIDGGIQVRTAGMPDKDGKFYAENAYNFKNRGMAVDLGFTLQATEKLRLTGSWLDLGSIKWTQNIKNFERENFVYTIDQANLNQIVSRPEYIGKLTDSLKQIYLKDGNSVEYRTALPTRLILGGNYDVDDYFSLGAVWFSDFKNKKYQPTLLFNGNFHIKKWLSINLNYLLTSRSANNLGVGVGLKGLGMSFFVNSDNIIGFMFPESSKVFHLSAGLGFCIGSDKKVQD